MPNILHNPIPAAEFSFYSLNWRSRIRKCLSRLKQDGNPTVKEAIEYIRVRSNLDAKLDSIFWFCVEDKGAWNSLMRYKDTLRNSEKDEDHTMLDLLYRALEDALGGIGTQPRFWSRYGLVAKDKDGKRYTIKFTAENALTACDWVTQAFMEQEDDITDDHKWTPEKLYYCKSDDWCPSTNLTEELRHYIGLK